MDLSMNSSTSTIYHISGGFKPYPIDLSFSCVASSPFQIPESITQIIHEKYKHRMVYFKPDYTHLTQIDNTTWKIPMIYNSPPEFIYDVLPCFQSYPEEYKQKIISFNVHIWEGNRMEAFERNACDILIRKRN